MNLNALHSSGIVGWGRPSGQWAGLVLLCPCPVGVLAGGVVLAQALAQGVSLCHSGKRTPCHCCGCERAWVCVSVWPCAHGNMCVSVCVWVYVCVECMSVCVKTSHSTAPALSTHKLPSVAPLLDCVPAQLLPGPSQNSHLPVLPRFHDLPGCSVPHFWFPHTWGWPAALPSSSLRM